MDQGISNVDDEIDNLFLCQNFVPSNEAIETLLELTKEIIKSLIIDLDNFEIIYDDAFKWLKICLRAKCQRTGEVGQIVYYFPVDLYFNLQDKSLYKEMIKEKIAQPFIKGMESLYADSVR